MKKFTRLVSVILAVLVICFTVSACGGNMNGWPTLNLNLDIESYDEVSLEYHHRSAHSDRMPLDIDRDYYGTSADREIISEVYQSIDGRLYSEETYNKIDTENYWSKVVITFWKDGEAEYTFTFYEYSVQNGYFIFDNGEIHKYLGDFVSGTYEKFKDKLLQDVGDDVDNEDITVAGIDKKDPYTWFDVNKTNLPSLKECQEITEGMSLNQVIRKIGKPQRDIGFGASIFQFDVDDGSILTVTFDIDSEKIERDPYTPPYDYLVVERLDFDTEIPDIYFPYYGTLNDLYSWIDELNVADVIEVRFEHAFIGVAPGHLKDISYSTNRIDIENTYRLLFSPLTSISDAEGNMTGGGYVKYDFFTAHNETYSIIVSNNTVRINNQYFKFIDTFYYAFLYSDVNCNSFITDDIHACEEYEIYTYAEESVKVGDYSGLREFEFCVYDGLIENTPKFYLRSSAVNLLILSSNQFMIEGDINLVVYQITGEKDFSALFAENDVVDDGMVRTKLNGGGWGAPSLPYYVSTEIVKRCLILDGVVAANVYLGHSFFGNSIGFSDFDFVLDISELQNCSFSIVADYNGSKRVTVMENVDYADDSYGVRITDLYDENEVYHGSVVNYSKYHSVNLDIDSMRGVSYGYVNIELRVQLPDGMESIVMTDTVYYSVTNTEIVFGLVSNPVGHEGDPGIITNGWTYGSD